MGRLIGVCSSFGSKKLCLWIICWLNAWLPGPTAFWLDVEYFFYIKGDYILFNGDFYKSLLKYGICYKSKAVTLLVSSISMHKHIISLIYGDNSGLNFFELIGMFTWYLSSDSVLQWAKGVYPCKSSYINTPNAQISVLGPYMLWINPYGDI